MCNRLDTELADLTADSDRADAELPCGLRRGEREPTVNHDPNFRRSHTPSVHSQGSGLSTLAFVRCITLLG